MVKSNRTFAASVTSSLADIDEEPIPRHAGGGEPTPAAVAYESRSASLARVAVGKGRERSEWVDPDRCRPWRLHNRDLENLSELTCAGLIDAFLAEGRQIQPAIVRRLEGDPNYDFEIVAGVRRWWTVKYLRAHQHPDFDYLVIVRSLTDEEAFRVADHENRSRKDLTDYERGIDYSRALKELYNNNLTRMAERIGVSKGWLSKLLQIPSIPVPIVEAYTSPHELTTNIAGQIMPLTRAAETRSRMEECARQIRADRERGEALPTPHITKRLIAAAREQAAARVTGPVTINRTTGQPMIEFTRKGRGGDIFIKLLHSSGADRAEIVKALDKLLADEWAAKRSG
ncbi:ParB/RepB/Spo0J family partition protein [Sphingomonas oryzagri]